MALTMNIPPSRVKNHVLNVNLNEKYNKDIEAIKEDYKQYIKNKKNGIVEYPPFTVFKEKFLAFEEKNKRLSKLKKDINKLDHLLNPDPNKKPIIIKGKVPRKLTSEEFEPTKREIDQLKNEQAHVERELTDDKKVLNELLASDAVVAALYKLEETKSKKYRMSEDARVTLACIINCYIQELLLFGYKNFTGGDKLTLEQFTDDKIRDHPMSQFVTYSEAYRKLSVFALLDKDRKKEVKSALRAKENEEIKERKEKRKQLQKLKDNHVDEIPDNLIIKQDTLSFTKFIKDILNNCKANDSNIIGKKISQDVVELLSDSIREFLKSFAHIAKEYLDYAEIKTINEDIVYLIVGVYFNTRKTFISDRNYMYYVKEYVKKYKSLYEDTVKLESDKRKQKKNEKEEKKKREVYKVTIGAFNGV